MEEQDLVGLLAEEHQIHLNSSRKISTRTRVILLEMNLELAQEEEEERTSQRLFS